MFDFSEMIKKERAVSRQLLWFLKSQTSRHQNISHENLAIAVILVNNKGFRNLKQF